MKYVEVGGVRLSAIGLGTWQFGSAEWGYGLNSAEGEAGKIVQRALKLGINLFDTAEAYGPRRSERILGEALQGNREKAFVATKFFPIGLPFMVAGRASGSARRLGVDHIDLFQQHWPSPLFPPGATMPRLRQLVERGVIRHVGVSNHNLRQWLACEDSLGGVVLSNQVRFSLIHSEPVRELLPWAQQNGRLIIAYSPLGQGALAGTYTARRRPRNFRRFREDFGALAQQRQEPLARALLDIANQHEAAPAQVALAWLIAKPNVVAIPGASSVFQVEQNARAADLQLREDELARLDSLAV